jgi:hypothetical protein
VEGPELRLRTDTDDRPRFLDVHVDGVDERSRRSAIVAFIQSSGRFFMSRAASPVAFISGISRD